MLGKTYMLGKLVCLVLLDSNSAEVKGRTIHDGGGIPYFADDTSDIWKPGVLVSARRAWVVVFIQKSMRQTNS